MPPYALPYEVHRCHVPLFAAWGQMVNAQGVGYQYGKTKETETGNKHLQAALLPAVPECGSTKNAVRNALSDRDSP